MAIPAADILILGPVVFTDFSPPEKMPFGGKQALHTHLMVGGRRVIDTMGPDDDPITWGGLFFGSTAYANCQLLDSLRIAGNPLALSWGGNSYNVVIAHFRADVQRLPHVVHYDIGCVVVNNGAQGLLPSFSASVDDLVASDVASIPTLSTPLPANVQTDVNNFQTAFNAANPVEQAATSVQAGVQASAQTMLNDTVAAIPTFASALDAPVATGMPSVLAGAVTNALASSQSQLSLVEMQGIAGRILTNLVSAGI